jgi:deoxyhypusine monooxygenase
MVSCLPHASRFPLPRHAALRNKHGTTLFRHEIAYVLGQMEAGVAVPTLLDVLRDTSDDAIVRHESAEALGAIADPATLEELEAFCGDASPEVAETCQIAAKRVRWMIDNSGDISVVGNLRENAYASIDPAPAMKKPTKAELPALASSLLDTSLPLFERYKAMFSLRNAGSKAAVLALCEGLKDASPLFRHEVAYVLGQLQHVASVPALRVSVADPLEHDMVRHEAAEALGAIGTSECTDFLEEYASEATPIMLRESCVVALDVADYWSSRDAPPEVVA